VCYNTIADVPAAHSFEVVDVAREYGPADADNAIRLYVSGKSEQETAEILGIGRKFVSNTLKRAGVPRRSQDVVIDEAEMVARYLAGESENALAEAYGCSRTAIRRRLLQAGVEPRNCSEGMYARMAGMTPQERSRLAQASHEASRGRVHTLAEREKVARGIECKGVTAGNVSPAEVMFSDMLSRRGLEVIHQKAVGPYNVDLAAGSVAVEILGGGWHRSKRHGERLRHILDAGWDVIYIWVSVQRPLTAGAAEYVVSHCQFRDRNPSAPRCYRVIRSSGEFITGGSADSDDIPDVLPVTSRPDVPPAEVPFGYCHCGCGSKTAIAKYTSTREGCTKGQPRQFIPGHSFPRRRNAS
jgi:hypothetical protein